MPSSTVEDYLKVIFIEGQRSDQRELVSPGLIAESLSLTPGTVTTMLKQLAKQGFVEYEPRKGVRLSEHGINVAIAVVRRHRLLELFLVNVLGYAWDEVHEEAELMEHVVSDFFVEKIDALLGCPSFDPHGAPIPSADGSFPEVNGMALSEAMPGKLRVLRVTSESPSLLRWLSDTGLMPNQEVEILSKDSIAETVTLVTAAGQQVVSLGVCQRLLVAPL
jgi:DtxR family Mn-dependent transcriptional regulator